MTPGMCRKINFCESYLPWCVTIMIMTPSCLMSRCLNHVVNLSVVAIMNHITKIAAIENATAIWEYDPNLPDNHMLGRSLDVIAAVCTIAIKVCWVYFNSSTFKLDFLSDPGFWSVNQVLQKAPNSMQNHQPTQNPASQQRPLGICFCNAWSVIQFTPSKSRPCFHQYCMTRISADQSISQICGQALWPNYHRPFTG